MTYLTEQFKDKKIWVNWRPMKVKGRISKLPYQTNGRMASSTDETTWSTYEQVKKESPNVGIIFSPEKTLLGVDIDHCLIDNKIEHEQKEAIAQFIIESDTYSEVSPSGSGIHSFFNLTAPIQLEANRKGGFECYTSGRYFTVTEIPYGEDKPVRTIDPDEAIRLLSILGYPWTKKDRPQQNADDNTVSADDRRISIKLEDDVLLAKMFGSKNGSDIKALYDGDTSAHENDTSKADASLCSHLAFWSGKDPVQIERLWTASPLGTREKTAERKDYRDRTIAHAIEHCRDVYSVPPQVIAAKKTAAELDLLYVMNDKKDKVYIQNTENMCRILRHHTDFAGRIRYDSFKNIFEIRPKDTDVWRSVEDNDAVNLQTAIQILFTNFGKVGKEMVYDALIKVGKENAIDSAADWIKSITWDNVPRLDSWLSVVYGTPDSEYHRKVGANWMKGLAKRIVSPGCKFDYVLVIEGPQGTRKSTSLAVLGGDWYVETNMGTDNKDFFMQFAGKVIIEFSEGETLNRTEVKKMKAIITTQRDRYRPPYERTPQDFPRRCVFAMTTNQEEYLKDETGNRRWLPVKLEGKEANIDWLTANRDQMFAEAYHRVVNLKETIYEFPREETLEMQNLRRIHDPNSELICDWYANKLNHSQRLEGITLQQVYRDALNGGFSGKGPMDRRDEMSITDVLRSDLKLERRRLMDGKSKITRWVDPLLPIKEPSPTESPFDEMMAGKGW